MVVRPHESKTNFTPVWWALGLPLSPPPPSCHSPLFIGMGFYDMSQIIRGFWFIQTLAYLVFIAPFLTELAERILYNLPSYSTDPSSIFFEQPSYAKINQTRREKWSRYCRWIRRRWKSAHHATPGSVYLAHSSCHFERNSFSKKPTRHSV